MDDALRAVESWPVDTVAVGIVDGGGDRVTHGPTSAVLPWASVTKPLAAHGVLLAAQHGALHLDEPAGPDGSTVRHLLAHASGLPAEAGGPISRVGIRRIYSNHGYDVLGELVSDRVGTAFSAHVAQEVLVELGMGETVIDGSPAHGARGSLDDLLTFAAELLCPALLDEPSATALADIQFAGLPGVLPGYGRQDDNAWGLGVEVRDAKTPHWTGPSQPGHTFGHFGQSGSFLWVDRDAGIAVACVTDRPFGDWAVEAWAPFNDRVWQAATGP